MRTANPDKDELFVLWEAWRLPHEQGNNESLTDLEVAKRAIYPLQDPLFTGMGEEI